MSVVKLSARITKAPADGVKVHDYPIEDGFIGGAVAEIEGRYPASGFVMNTKIKEVAYVLAGSGTFETRDASTDIAAGDFIFVDHRQAFAWHGVGLKLFISTTPAFEPTQYVSVE